MSEPSPPPPNARFVYADDDPARLDVTCSVCREAINAPNKGFGRALVAVFKTQHQHIPASPPTSGEGK